VFIIKEPKKRLQNVQPVKMLKNRFGFYGHWNTIKTLFQMQEDALKKIGHKIVYVLFLMDIYKDFYKELRTYNIYM
jgi:hypothetical protein